MDDGRDRGEVVGTSCPRVVIVMLRLVNLEEIQNLRLHVPELVQILERHEPKFVDGVKAWLAQVEQALLNNRMPVAAEVATLRSVLIGAERGVMPPGLIFSGRTTPRKVKDAAAAEVLRKADEIVSNAIRTAAEQFAEGERLARQMMALAQHKGLLAAGATFGSPAARARALWDAMRSDPDLGPGTTHLAGLVGVYDALILLDRLLPA